MEYHGIYRYLTEILFLGGGGEQGTREAGKVSKKRMKQVTYSKLKTFRTSLST